MGIGPGESSVLAIARSHPNMIAIIDDLVGRRCELTPIFRQVAVQIKMSQYSGILAPGRFLACSILALVLG